MKYLDEYSDKKLIDSTLALLNKMVIPGKKYRFMEFCGGHTHTFFKSGLIDLLPKEIELIHGPGCPVCVLPSERIDTLIQVLENRNDIIICTYADLMRVPGKKRDSLQKAKARGLAVRSVYSPLNALEIAGDYPDKKIVFFAIGFETTTPPTVLALKAAIEKNLENFFIYCNHVKTGPALEYILTNERDNKNQIDGFIGPGHVASIIGADFFSLYAKKYNKPVVIAGFTPYDLAKSLVLLVRQINKKTAEAQVEYSRVVTPKGNSVALNLMDKYLEDRNSFEWRGLGYLPNSAYKIKNEYAKFDAENKFDLAMRENRDHPTCLCPKILLGEKKPLECKLFGKVCNPERPLGPCMVSSEGACAAYFNSGRHLLGEAHA